MSEKHINYNARTFEEYRSELLQFTKEYYPELAERIEDSSIGSWIIDLFSAVADDLSYHTDRVYQNTNVDSSENRASLMSIARNNGVKIPGKKAAMCEFEFTCELPAHIEGNSSRPDWNYAPVIKRSTRVTNGQVNFELDEDVNFAEQFNKDGYSNRKYTPIFASNGSVSAYKVSKSVIGRNVTTKIYQKVLKSSDLKPFMEVILNDDNVAAVESIIFKETSDYKRIPSTEEFFYNDEVYRVKNESIYTHRYFEVNSLSEQYVFGERGGQYGDQYEDYVDDDTFIRVYEGVWKGIKQKYITEYTDAGYMKITFGPGAAYETVKKDGTPGESIMCKIVNNEMLGVLPKAGWTMYVLYDVVDGQVANLAAGSVNTLSNALIEMPGTSNADESNKSKVVKSITVSNITNVYGGKDEPNNAELRNIVKFNAGAKQRAVVINDYKDLINNIPARYACPFRFSVKEENNKILISLLNVNARGKLESALPDMMVKNMIEYLSMYKTLGDFVAIESGKIYNLGVNAELYIDKNYTTSSVIAAVIEVIKGYFDVATHEMGEDIFIADLERLVMGVDGVLGIIDLSVYNIYGGSYSEDICPLPRATDKVTDCNGTIYINPNVGKEYGGTSFKIDLERTDNILYMDDNAMGEIKYPNKDIVIKAKVK